MRKRDLEEPDAAKLVPTPKGTWANPSLGHIELASAAFLQGHAPQCLVRQSCEQFLPGWVRADDPAVRQIGASATSVDCGGDGRARDATANIGKDRNEKVPDDGLADGLVDLSGGPISTMRSVETDRQHPFESRSRNHLRIDARDHDAE